MNERAVSHMVGFILIFTIIMTGATFALVIGQDALGDVSTYEQSKNAERVMTLFEGDLDQLVHSRASTTESTINLNDGQIRRENVSTVHVSIESEATGSVVEDTIPIGSLVYEMGGTVLRYENGMVIRTDRDDGVAVTDHEVSCTEDRAIVSLVTLEGVENRQLSSGIATVDTFHDGTNLVYPVNRTGEFSAVDAENVTIEVDSPNGDVWGDTLVTTEEWSRDDEGNFYCDVGSEGEVYVRQTVVDLALAR